MILRPLLLLALMLSCAATAQEYELDTNALQQVLDSAGDWAAENFDEEVLRELPPLDRDRVEQFICDLQKSLEGAQVLDLASLKAAATFALPLLEAREETQPYAAWLKSRLDYLEVAEELRQAAPPVALVPGQPPTPPRQSNPVRRAKSLEAETHRTALAQGRNGLGAETQTHFCQRARPVGTRLAGRGRVRL